MVKREKSHIIKLPRSKEKISKLEDKMERDASKLVRIETALMMENLHHSAIEQWRNSSLGYRVTILNELLTKDQVNLDKVEKSLWERYKTDFDLDAYLNACRTIKRYCN